MANSDCKICFEKFDRVKHKPFILISCGHTYCIVCINKFKEKKCPKCNGVIEDKKSNTQLLDMLELTGIDYFKDELGKSINQIEATKSDLLKLTDSKVKQSGENLKKLNAEINAKSEEIIKCIHSNQRKLLDQIKNFDSKPIEQLNDHLQCEKIKMELKISEAYVLLDNKDLDINHLADFLKEFTLQNEKLAALNERINGSNLGCIYELDSKSSKLPADIIGKITEKKFEPIKEKTNENKQKISISNDPFSYYPPLAKQIDESKAQQLDYHMTEACKHLHTLRMKKAIEHLDEVIKLDSTFHDPFGKKAYALGHLLRYDEALPYYVLSHKNHPNQIVTYFHQGEAYRELFKYKESVDAFKECLRINPHYNEALYEIARVYAQAQNFKESLDYFKKANYNRPNNFYYAHYKALSLMGLKRFDESIVYLDAALEDNPNDFQLYMAKAGTYCGMQRIDKAIACYDKALELNPDADYIRTSRDNLKRIHSRR